MDKIHLGLKFTLLESVITSIISQKNRPKKNRMEGGVAMHAVLTWFGQIRPEYRGAIFLVTGISLFGMVDNLFLVVMDQVGVGQFHFSRSLVCGVMLFVLGRMMGVRLLAIQWKPVLLRALFFAFSMVLYFSVLPIMPIAEAGAGLFTSPIFVLLFSALIFRERIGWRRIVAVAMGSVGVLMVLQPAGADFTIYNLLPILAGASYAMGAIITFRHCRDESHYALLMSFLIATGLMGGIVATALTIFPVPADLLAEAPFLFRPWQGIDLMYCLWMAGISAVAVFGLLLMTRAYQLMLTSYVVIYEYAYLLSAGVFGWLLWGDVLSGLSIIGIVLIVGAGIIVALAQQKQ